MKKMKNSLTLKKMMMMNNVLDDLKNIDMNKMDINDALNWITKWRHILRIKTIELETDIPTGTLKRVLTADADLPEHWHEPLIKFVEKMVKA